MFEHFFSRKLQNRQRELELDQLNAALVALNDHRQDVSVSEVGDSATCLPSGFLHNRSAPQQQG